MADKLRAMMDFGMENTRMKDLFDVAARVRAGRFDVDEVARALAYGKDSEIETALSA